LNVIPPLPLNLTDKDIEVPSQSLNNISTLEEIEKSQMGNVKSGDQRVKFEGQQIQQLTKQTHNLLFI
jgi:hypothetical protein